MDKEIEISAGEDHPKITKDSMKNQRYFYTVTEKIKDILRKIQEHFGILDTAILRQSPTMPYIIRQKNRKFK